MSATEKTTRARPVCCLRNPLWSVCSASFDLSCFVAATHLNKLSAKLNSPCSFDRPAVVSKQTSHFDTPILDGFSHRSHLSAERHSGDGGASTSALPPSGTPGSATCRSPSAAELRTANEQNCVKDRLHQHTHFSLTKQAHV